MPAHIRFRGRVFPQGEKITAPTFALAGSSGDQLRVRSEVSISLSNVTVDCEVISGDFDNRNLREFVFQHARMAAQTCADIFGFKTGFGFFVVLESEEQPPGSSSRPLSIRIPGLSELVTAVDADDYLALIKRAVEIPQLRNIFSDLSMGLTIPQYSAVSLGRALDGVRHIVAPNLQPRDGWPILHAALRIEKDYINEISQDSAKPRHGERFLANGNDHAREMAARTWKIVNRLIFYLENGCSSLSEAEFPLLSNDKG